MARVPRVGRSRAPRRRLEQARCVVRPAHPREAIAAREVHPAAHPVALVFEAREVHVDAATRVRGQRVPRAARPADDAGVVGGPRPAGVDADVEPIRPVGEGALVGGDPFDRSTERTDGGEGPRGGPARVPVEQRRDRSVAIAASLSSSIPCDFMK